MHGSGGEMTGQQRMLQVTRSRSSSCCVLRRDEPKMNMSSRSSNSWTFFTRVRPGCALLLLLSLASLLSFSPTSAAPLVSTKTVVDRSKRQSTSADVVVDKEELARSLRKALEVLQRRRDDLREETFNDYVDNYVTDDGQESDEEEALEEMLEEELEEEEKEEAEQVKKEIVEAYIEKLLAEEEAAEEEKEEAEEEFDRDLKEYLAESYLKQVAEDGEAMGVNDVMIPDTYPLQQPQLADQAELADVLSDSEEEEVSSENNPIPDASASDAQFYDWLLREYEKEMDGNTMVAKRDGVGGSDGDDDGEYLGNEIAEYVQEQQASSPAAGVQDVTLDVDLDSDAVMELLDQVEDSALQDTLDKMRVAQDGGYDVDGDPFAEDELRSLNVAYNVEKIKSLLAELRSEDQSEEVDMAYDLPPLVKRDDLDFDDTAVAGGGGGWDEGDVLTAAAPGDLLRTLVEDEKEEIVNQALRDEIREELSRTYYGIYETLEGMPMNELENLADLVEGVAEERERQEFFGDYGGQLDSS